MQRRCRKGFANRLKASASTAAIDAMGLGDAWPGPAVPAPLAVDVHHFTLRVFGGEIAFNVKRRT